MPSPKKKSQVTTSNKRSNTTSCLEPQEPTQRYDSEWFDATVATGCQLIARISGHLACADVLQVYKVPRRPFESARLDAELKLAGEFGLRNKREIWRYVKY